MGQKSYVLTRFIVGETACNVEWIIQSREMNCAKKQVNRLLLGLEECKTHPFLSSKITKVRTMNF